ncbi:hypothetical protein SETIT_2G245400v2 [Setaria italica]|uniref:F-box domain-containing protein n=1 Tax=Setaria italica TaxID=4555 RepID=A0A368Q2J7_SETIT|nr:hypothetical protein SETIT_2G245400v2 [Setaria italica]
MEVQARKKQCITLLPEDMIELILVWLPANTLTRHRIVCKQWNRIIQDPQFIMAHLQRAPHRPLLFYNRASISNKLYPSEAILFDEAWSPSRWNVPVIEPDDFLCASCNGLVLLYSDKSTIKIANLATGKCLHIAKPVTKEYKVIHILCEKVHAYGDKFDIIQVYTLGEDKWRDIRVPEVQSLYDMERSGVVIVDGAMYWLNGKKENKWGRAVVSFDLSEERFEWIQLPNNADLENSPRGLVGKLQIWTLDNKIDQSWSQKYIIQLSSVNIPRLYFIHGGKIVVYDHGRNLYYHELIGQNVRIEQRKMMKLLNYGPRWRRSMQSYKHVESLVRLDAFS